MANQIERAKKLIESGKISPEDKEFLEKEISLHVHEMREKRLCAFCQHHAFIQVDDSAIMVCTHCFKIFEENISSLKQFLGCK
jgi:hypothetical protein